MPWRWEEQAENWVRWARLPGHDAYWDFADAFFGLLPPPSGPVLEIGCGEGRVVRDLIKRGYRVIGVELSATLIAHAAADPEGTYVRADAARLPFVDATFDLVVAFNSLMDIADMPAAVREAARVLRPKGRLCISITHPIADAGAFTSRDPEAAFVIESSYLEEREFEQTFERDGLSMTFSGWEYPLQSYFQAFEAAGFLVERLREPRVPDETVARDPAERRWQRIPNFLHLVAVLK